MSMLVDNEKMVSAYTAIDNLSKDFKTKAGEFITELTNALATFEGETKDVLMEKKIGTSGSETEGTLAYFVETQIPGLLDGLAQLLEGNRDTVEKGDKQFAEALRG